MNIIVGHSNMDLDCFGSMVLARYLFPNHYLITSRQIHPVAKNLYNLYQNHLAPLRPKDLRGERVEHMVILDTRTYRRVEEYFKELEAPPDKIDVFDHHLEAVSDIPGAVVHSKDVGANTTQIGLLCLERSITLNDDAATIALTGIYADTGNFTHEDVTSADFAVARYLMDQNASIKLVKEFLKTLKEEHQITLFHELLNRISYQDIHGHFLILSYIELEKQVGGLAAVVEKVFEVENTDAIFAVFYFKKEQDTIIIGRSQKQSIDMNSLLSLFGGGGHAAAASALVKNGGGREVFQKLIRQLHTSLMPAVTADQIMTTDVGLLQDSWSMMDASIFLEKINHTGAPVVDKEGSLVGMLTLKDIMKGRKAGEMHAPVKAYMAKKLITGRRNSTVREIEQLLYKNNIGHLPILEEGKLKGLVTRSDYLRFVQQHLEQEKPILERLYTA
jgi:tRNA nucleotidyltransferase (CCA-adding enzyme)